MSSEKAGHPNRGHPPQQVRELAARREGQCRLSQRRRAAEQKFGHWEGAHPMRKDAKIGFAIGGVLLAVLTVYVIVVPRHNNAISPNAVTLSVPADEPGGTSNTPADNSDATPKPPTEVARNTSSDGVKWEPLLKGGGEEAPPLMTTTVTPPTNGGGVSVPEGQATAE